MESFYNTNETQIAFDIKVGETHTGKIYALDTEWCSIDVGYRELVYVDLSRESSISRDKLIPGNTISVQITGDRKSNKKGFILGSVEAGVKSTITRELLASIEEGNTAYVATVNSMIQGGGYIVNVQGIDCFMPGSLAGINKLVNFESIIGTKIYVVPMSYSLEKGTIVVSHRKYLQALIPNKVEEVIEDVKDTLNDRGSALKYPQLILGMIAIFVYVGVEVSTASNLPDFMESKLGFATKDIAPYVSLYWASLMIGRWTGAVEAFSVTASTQKILKFLAPYIAFGVFLVVNAIAKSDLTPFYVYALVIVVLIAADIASKGNPARMLLIFSTLGIISLLIGMSTTGMLSVYAFTSVGLFCSTLWPCIFTLAISGLGKNTNQGSNFLIMMIMGGGIVSWLQGVVADKTDIQFSYIVGVVCFVYLAFYAWKVSGILRNQGIDFDKKVSGGH
jgi:fucose permease